MHYRSNSRHQDKVSDIRDDQQDQYPLSVLIYLVPPSVSVKPEYLSHDIPSVERRTWYQVEDHEAYVDADCVIDYVEYVLYKC